MSMKNPLTPGGIEPATFRFVAQHLSHSATAVPVRVYIYIYIYIYANIGCMVDSNLFFSFYSFDRQGVATADLVLGNR